MMLIFLLKCESALNVFKVIEKQCKVHDGIPFYTGLAKL